WGWTEHFAPPADMWHMRYEMRMLVKPVEFDPPSVTRYLPLVREISDTNPETIGVPVSGTARAH
ncbi:MAG: hypothetical protein OEW46_10165, partial [Actinomycetota bacterium]|nr:hypothetical protein [Actinomycetota bacterium]